MLADLAKISGDGADLFRMDTHYLENINKNINDEYFSNLLTNRSFYVIIALYAALDTPRGKFFFGGDKMTWGTFGTLHIVTLVLSAAINIALYFILRNQTRRVQIITLFALSFAGIGAILFNLLTWNSPWEYLPLHLCSLNAILLPFAVLTRKKWACNLLLLWSLGAYIALILNYGMTNAEIFSWTFFFYYFPHTLEAGIPILLFALGLVDRDYKTIKSTLIITFVSYTVIHFINLAVNSAGIVGPDGEKVVVNYMFSLSPDNPFLQLLWNLWAAMTSFLPFAIGPQYFYMLLAVPVILLYLVWWYLPELLDAHKKKKLIKAQLDVVDDYYDEYEKEYTKRIIKKKRK